MSGHTATPWNVRDHGTSAHGRHIWVEGGPAIGETRAGPYKRQILEDEDYDEKAADAALIVTACNSHADLVRALEEIRDGAGDRRAMGRDQMANIARAALATLTARKVG